MPPCYIINEKFLQKQPFLVLLLVWVAGCWLVEATVQARAGKTAIF